MEYLCQQLRQKKIEQLLIFLVDRYPFRELRTLLQSKELDAAPSKNKLFEKFADLTGDQARRADEILTEMCADLVVAGTKDVFVFDLKGDEVEEIASSISGINLPTNAYSALYPLPLPTTELKSQSKDHELVRRIAYPNGDISLVLCAKRSQEDRETYNYSQVADAVKEAFTDFDEFIAVRRIDYQVFDIVTLRRSLRRLEVLIDHPSRIRLPFTSNTRCKNLLERLSTRVEGIKTIYEADSPMNLSSCISAFYQ